MFWVVCLPGQDSEFITRMGLLLAIAAQPREIRVNVRWEAPEKEGNRRQLNICCDGTNNNLTRRRSDTNVSQLC